MSTPAAMLVVLRIAGTLLITLLLSACWPARGSIKPSHIRVLPFATHEENGSGRLAPIRGLRAAVQSTASQPVRVLVVHGMRTREPDYSATLQDGIARERLGLAHHDRVDTIPLKRAYQVRMSAAFRPRDGVDMPPSELRRHAWYDPATGTDRLVFYEMLWAPTRDAVKDYFFGCFESGARPGHRCPDPPARRNLDRQVWVNGFIKDSLMVDGFGDATVVLGPTGDLLRDDVDLAFCAIGSEILRSSNLWRRTAGEGERCDLADGIGPAQQERANAALRSARMFVLTHSLGSFLVMEAHQRYLLADAMARAAKPGAEAAPSVILPPAVGALRAGTAVQDASDAVRGEALLSLLDSVTVFMRANQVSLLGLARVQPGCFGFRGGPGRGSLCPNKFLPLHQTGAAVAGPRRQLNQYVAFNDVDDLLGFELPPYLGGVEPFGTLVNVSVRNSYLGLPWIFRNPGDAHTSSDRNPAILDAIVDGFPLPEFETAARRR